MHWATEYVGKPHRLGARGPDAYDCWGLLVEVYRSRFGITLPTLAGISVQSSLTIHREIVANMEEDWHQVIKPFDGCAVAMSQRRAYHHVGIFIEADGNKILHCWDAQNVIVDTVLRLRLKGFRYISYFKHRLWPT